MKKNYTRCLFVFIAAVGIFTGLGASKFYQVFFKKSKHSTSHLSVVVKNSHNKVNDHLITSAEIWSSMTKIAKVPSYAQRQTLINDWIKMRSAAECKILLNSVPLGWHHEELLIAGRWIALDSEGIVMNYPNGEYIELLAKHNSNAASKWFYQILSEHKNEESDVVSQVKYGYYKGLGSKDPILARNELIKNDDIRYVDCIIDFVVERGVIYALDWLESASDEVFIRSKEDLFFQLARYYPEQLLPKIISNGGEIIHGDLNCSIAVVAGIAISDPNHALKLIKSSGNSEIEFLEQVFLLLLRESQDEIAYHLVKLLPNDEKFDIFRSLVAGSSISQKFDFILTFREPLRTDTFKREFEEWLSDSETDARIWLLKNKANIPPHLTEWDEIETNKFHH